ncbi:MAG: cytochrome P450 [Scytonema sp. RU_4_4]|nr:cytochrome P450 [Scytonema sp. RU_4_4]NJR74148.1 cytochrome P450 [Scytonema sp. CRU_2_7]
MKLPPKPRDPNWLFYLKFKADPLGYMDVIYKHYGDIVTIVSDSQPMIYISNPQGIKEIFSNTKEITASGALNQSFAMGTGKEGVLQLDGLRHKHRRKLLMTSFQGGRTQAFGQRICELTDTIMSKQVIGKPFLAYEIIEDIALRIGIELVVGLSEGDRYEKIKHLFSFLMKYEQSPFFNLLLQLPFVSRDLGRWSPQGYLLNLYQKIFQSLYSEVSERRQKPDPLSSDTLSTLISACDETGEALSDEEVRDLLLSPIFAAQHASGAAITWSLYWIHRLPEVRDKLLQELNTLGESPDPMSIVALPYLNNVCNEALRIYPTQLFTFPRLVESTVEIMGYEFDPGTILIGNIYSTHQREDIYPEPKQFKPERFFDRQYSSFEFLPFGGGARSCIGGAFALFEMKLVLATILSRYQLALVSKKAERPKYGGLISYPASGVKMVMHGRRKYQGQSQPSAVGLI